MAKAHRNSLQPGQKVQWFEVVKILGQGGFGITYLALDTNLDQKVAIKEYLPIELSVRESDSSVHPLSEDHHGTFKWGLDRFITEAKTLAKFHHPNIVQVFTVFEANNTAYIVMRFEEGQSLQEIITRRKTLEEAELLKILIPLLGGLEIVHAQGFIHRDIKPANIFVREDGSPVLIDFGSARQALGVETQTLTSLVSPGYAPFEQYTSKSDKQGPWTDIYGLGATLYRAVSGRSPQDAVDRSESIIHTNADIFVPATEVGTGKYSERFLAAINWALAFRPQDRPQTVAAWRDSFGQWPAEASEARTVAVPEQQPDQAISTQETVLQDVETEVADATDETTVVVADEPKSEHSRKWLTITVMILVAIIAVGAFVLFSSNRVDKPVIASADDPRQEPKLASQAHVDDLRAPETAIQAQVVPVTEVSAGSAVAEVVTDLEEPSVVPDAADTQARSTETTKRVAEGVPEERLQSGSTAAMDRGIQEQQQVITAVAIESLRDTLKDGSPGPEMVAIPVGSFRMGDLKGDGIVNERPVHEVTISKPFALSKYEVSFDEYDVFVAASASRSPADKRWGRGNRPVIKVNWTDAVAYTAWLSQQTGKRYRLPSESEWEFAARAGSESSYSWGDFIERGLANCVGCGSQWDRRQTAPVGSFAANTFGVHDMHGNVLEWIQDCWHGAYTGAPADGSAWVDANACKVRVVRGGAWNSKPKNLRASHRLRFGTNARISYLGIRLARDL